MRRASRDAARNGERWLILAVLFLARTVMGLQFQAVATLSSYVMADLSIDYARLGWLIGLYLLPGIAIAYPGGLLGQKFGDKRIAVLGMALMVVGGLATAVTDNYAIVAAGRLVAGSGAVLLNVLLTKMTTDWFIGREIGTALAVLAGSWPIGIGAALVILPWLAVHASPAAAFASTAAAAAGVLLLIALVIARRRWRRRSPRRRSRATECARACRARRSASHRSPAACGCCSTSATSW